MLTPERERLIREHYWYTADDDYICARLAARNGLFKHFAWNAGQALEKYIKCAILLEGGSAQFSHKFCSSFKSRVFATYTNAFPTEINVCRFAKVADRWKDFAKESFLECLKRFEQNGSARGRYREIDLLIKPLDLQKLDRLVFFLRPFCSSMEDIKASPERLESEHAPAAAKSWPTIQFGLMTEEKEKALRWENCANFPEVFKDSRGWSFMYGGTAPSKMLHTTSHLNDGDLEWLEQRSKFRR
ncbi:MAG: hypothetical protein AAFN94_03435 [Pseudomonadota bacterium]